MTTPKTAAPETIDIGPQNAAFHRALRKYPDAFEALHFFWNEAFAPAQCDVHSGSDIPSAKPSEAMGGWRVDVDWLSDMQTNVEKATGYGVTLECVEEIVLRTAALASPVPSAGRGGK
jgi:hypothetical protein